MRPVAGATFLVLLAAAGCAKESDSKFDVVRVTDRGFLTNAPTYIAEEEGFFEDEGVRLEYGVAAPSSNQLIPLLERRDLDVVSSSLSAGLYSAILQGAGARIVVDRGHFEPAACHYSGILGRRGVFRENAVTGADMRGKRFAISPSGFSAFVADKYLSSIGLTTADLKLARLGETLEAQAIEAGSIDGLHVAEPYLSRLRGAGHVLLASGDDFARGSHFAVLVFGPSLTIDNRNLGERFIKAYLRGVQQFNQGATPRNVAILTKRTGIDSTVLRSLCLPAIYPDGHLNLETLGEFQRWAHARGDIERVPGDSAGVDLEFARKAAAELKIPATVR